MNKPSVAAAPAVMICGHGSRDTDAVEEFNALVAQLRALLAGRAVSSGFLEFARPTIAEGFETLAAHGARSIMALPAMLFAASHVKNDLPWEVNSFRAAHPGIEVTFGRDLSIEPKLLRAAAARINQAELAAPRQIARAETVLLAVGRGTNDPDANSNVAKVARMLGEGMGFGWADAAFSGVAAPLVDAALDRLVRLGFARILVFPYFLFTGILVKRIYAWTDAAAAKYPTIDFVKAQYLSHHPLVVETFLDRLAETEQGSPAMNCQFCKYREQVVGYETEVGAVQAGHHHHVRGIGTDADHDHGHAHDHGHDHGHRLHGGGHE
jgi:sirohydrochlorin cobaltochelatase